MSVTAVSQSLVGTSNSTAATGKLASDYQSFITLLVAQVRNQDPLAPMESTEFVSQLAQLTQVEQSVQVNSHMEQLRQQLALNAALSQTDLIGREVTLPTDQFNVDVSGGRFWYKLEQDAVSVQAQIRDSEGVLVAVIDDLPSSGGQMTEVVWDGMGADGLPAPEGRYQIAIAAINNEGSASGAYQSYAASTVTAIDYSDGSSWLQLADGRRVGSGEIVGAR